MAPASRRARVIGVAGVSVRSGEPILKPTPTRSTEAPTSERPRSAQTLPKAGNNKSRQGRHRFSHAIQERCLDGLMASEGTKQVEIVAKAVSADAGARVEAHVAVRLGGRSFRHLARGDTQAVRQARDLADQTDAGGEEGVLQQLREFGHLGR